MKDLDWNMCAFLNWLEHNREAHTLKGLTIKDGYAWYNEQWKCWLKNSDAGKQVQSTINSDMMSPMDVENERFKYNPTGETTIEFPKKHQPEQYDHNL